MDILGKIKEKNTLITIGILLVLFLVVLYIRGLPVVNLGTTDILNIVGSDDPMYNLRQTEQVLANFPSYAWYEAMTLFPTGQTVPWGPLFIWMTATVSLITGASTRTEIIEAALWVPPLLAALMVPVTFALSRKIWNWKAGIFGAVFIAFIGGQFFFRSLAGYLDHHVAEVLFSTIFILAYTCALVTIRKHPVDFSNRSTLKMPLISASIAGFAYILGILVMPTIILYGVIVSVFTIVIFIIDTWYDISGAGILLLNSVVFGLAALAIGALRIPGTGLELFLYSPGQILAYIAVIAGTGVLYLLSEYCRKKSRALFPVAVIVLLTLTFAAAMVILPDLFASFIDGLKAFFGFHPYAITIQEARPWTLAEAWQVFNLGLLLMIGGILILLYKNWKQYRPEHIFVLVWTVFIIIAAFREVRYEYYLAANVAVLGGICVGAALEYAWPDIKAMGKRAAVKGPKEEPKEEKGSVKKKKADAAAKKSRQKTSPKPKVNYATILVTGIICACAVIFVVTSSATQYAVASSGAIRMNQDWRESLEWMNTSTPDTGVDYFAIYDRETFTYPDTAYGVMSWWDYGHLITYVARRIPNANPFQSGITPNGSADFFMSQSEEETNRIADLKGTRYVMTDIEMDTGKFWAMATWYNASVGQRPYQPVYLVPVDPANPRNFQPMTMYTGEYFRTTISRLHNFDGSFTLPGQVYYIEYTTSQGTSYPIVTNAQVMEASQAHAAADQYNAHPPEGHHAAVVSPVIVQPTVTLPALQHYRLVHESPSNVFGGKAPVDLKYVKVFEYVPGARIKGEGIIELPLVTNTGRQFTWQAESVNGEFVVPYSTEGNPYDVRAAGKYRITGTGREVAVSEAAVMGGAAVP
ncbi:MAG TPA: oligosaccharyl transferase, archaeosortase A system-associated [Methanoregulaceae archaeon]|nr:MAG: oligosaccharyl transferase, archaeosortase A system-associated [Methanolinea sp.]HON81824.1 oligosaccharyl transferase, archaeosortase A system-associated [Methanoregulaceae archaeon]HPD10854.1 oligosaccharyl transferase, archaeosortase A system-associated [Methanoregulaceae archaeon]HRT15650.1 oligosaccharyl transferase, archaeosortase A system-associated [Methanoregulaceae archaeon]HRU31511.1 oligosaccharyl transferase, archaeosortase A system-associated [Methanoregulaceae archaeon]